MEPKLSRAGARALLIMSLDDSYDFQDLETFRASITSANSWDELAETTKTLITVLLKTKGLTPGQFE